MELDFTLLAQAATLDRAYQPVSPYPATRRDLAVVVRDEVLWADILRCVQTSAPQTLESVEMFDVYRGDPVPAGSKSVAFAMTFRRPDRTITAGEADESTRAVLSVLENELGARLR